MEQLYEGLRLVLDTPINEIADGPIDDLITRLDAVKRIIAHAGELKAALELQLLDELQGDSTIAVAGVGTLKRDTKKGSKVKQGATDRLREELPTAVARKVSIDPYTGEVSADRREGAADAVRLMLRVVTVTASSVKQSARELIGLDPEDYVQETSTPFVAIEPEVDA